MSDGKPKGVEFRSDDEDSPYRYTFRDQRPGPWLHPIDPGYVITDKPRVDRPRKREKKHPDRWLKKRVKGRLTAKRIAKLFGGVS